MSSKALLSLASLVISTGSGCLVRHSFACEGETMSVVISTGTRDGRDIVGLTQPSLGKVGRGRAVGLYARLSAQNHAPPSQRRMRCPWDAAKRSPLLPARNRLVVRLRVGPHQPWLGSRNAPDGRDWHMPPDRMTMIADHAAGQRQPVEQSCSIQRVAT